MTGIDSVSLHLQPWQNTRLEKQCGTRIQRGDTVIRITLRVLRACKCILVTHLWPYVMKVSKHRTLKHMEFGTRIVEHLEDKMMEASHLHQPDSFCRHIFTRFLLSTLEKYPILHRIV